MAVPDIRIWEMNMMTGSQQLDTSSKRVGTAFTTGEIDINNPLDFGSIYIEGGSKNSRLRAFLIGVGSTWAANGSICNMRLWLSNWGSNNAWTGSETNVKFVHCAMGSTSYNQWIQNPAISNYSSTPNGGWANIGTFEPASANIFNAVGTIQGYAGSDASDTTEAIVMYMAIGSTELVGVYNGSNDASQQFTINFKYDYA